MTHLLRKKFIEDTLFNLRPFLLEGYTQIPSYRNFGLNEVATDQKASFKDLVTLYDKQVEEKIVSAIEKKFPNERVLGEEGSQKDYATQVQKWDSAWFIDPIDGTTNFSKSYPFFCSTIAFAERSKLGNLEVVAGAVYDPLKDEMFSAAKDHGAWLNRQRIHVSNISNHQQALLCTGFAVDREEPPNPLTLKMFDDFVRLTRKTLGVRRDGAAALDLAYVACGRTDVFWELGLSPWDIAAGDLLLREAGGQSTMHSGKNMDIIKGEILACNEYLHPWMVSELSIK